MGGKKTVESNLREIPPSVLLFKTFRFKIPSARCQQTTGHAEGQRIYKPIRHSCIKS